MQKVCVVDILCPYCKGKWFIYSRKNNKNYCLKCRKEIDLKNLKIGKSNS